MADPALMRTFAEWCKRELVNLRQRLEPLESGRMHLGSREPGAPWENITPREIGRIKQYIAELEALIAQCGGKE